MTDDDDTVNMDDGTYMLPARGVHRGGGGGQGGSSEPPFHPEYGWCKPRP